MKRVLHLSDLHFGRINPSAIEALEIFLKNQKQAFDLIIMTGDWTQRARVSQYQEAAEFISGLNVPVLSIPGNHDIPLYNFIARTISPWRNYRKFIQPLTVNIFEDPELVAVGFHTATYFRTVEGRISSSDLKRAQAAFAAAGPRAVKVVACHHPVFDPHHKSLLQPKDRVEALIALQPDIILSGHSHLNWIEMVQSESGHKVLHISAGSAVSNRLRGAVNSFHTLEIHEKSVKVETFFLEPSGFITLEKVAAQSLSF